MSLRAWLYDEVVWGVTLCVLRCGRSAEALLDDEPVCLACGDALLERLVAVAHWPELRELLPPLPGDDHLDHGWR